MNTTRIRELRLQQGLTQEQLAARAKISQPSLSQYEVGTALPSLKAAQRIASALGVSMDALISSTNGVPDEPR